jgi:AcrR family transcriptional regulator
VTVADTDHRRRPRRRGAALETAILDAVLAELAEVGYARLSVERVAERAGASKASLYRRWPSKVELVMDAVYHLLPDPASPPDTGSLRGDLLAVMRAVAEQLAGPAGQAMGGILSDALGDPDMARRVRSYARGTSQAGMREIARRAVARGEVDPAAVTERRLEAGHAMLRHHFITRGVPIPDHVIVEIADEVMIPLLQLPAQPGSTILASSADEASSGWDGSTRTV